MPEFNVSAPGGRPPKARTNKAQKGSATGGRRGNPLFRALFGGLLLPFLILFGVVGTVGIVFGTPHVGWDYGCIGPTRAGGGCQMTYAWCEYYGVQGRRIVNPEPGEFCGLIKMVPIDWGQMREIIDVERGPVLLQDGDPPPRTLDF